MCSRYNYVISVYIFTNISEKFCQKKFHHILISLIVRYWSWIFFRYLKFPLKNYIRYKIKPEYYIHCNFIITLTFHCENVFLNGQLSQKKNLNKIGPLSLKLYPVSIILCNIYSSIELTYALVYLVMIYI